MLVDFISGCLVTADSVISALLATMWLVMAEWLYALWQLALAHPVWSVALTALALLALKVHRITDFKVASRIQCTRDFAHSRSVSPQDFPQVVPNHVRTSPGQSPPPLYPNGWIPIMDSRDIGRNQVKSVIAFGVEVAVIRGSNNQVYVIDAYCPHMGANLAIGGRVFQDECQRDCIRCPFHEWTFTANDGLCRHIPYEEGNDALIILIFDAQFPFAQWCQMSR